MAISPVSGYLNTITVTISSGSSLSDAVQVNGKPIVSVQMPTAWTAAGLSFQGSIDGVTYGPVRDVTQTETTFVTTATNLISVDDALLLLGMNYIKLQSGTSGTPVAQGGDRIITLGVLSV